MSRSRKDARGGHNNFSYGKENKVVQEAQLEADVETLKNHSHSWQPAPRYGG